MEYDAQIDVARAPHQEYSGKPGDDAAWVLERGPDVLEGEQYRSDQRCPERKTPDPGQQVAAEVTAPRR